MSLIALPGSPEFEETAKTLEPLPGPPAPGPAGRVIAFVPKSESTVADVLDPEDLRGKTLMLNLAVCRGFACGGFQLSLHRNFAVVDDRAQQGPIRQALLDGKLVDITGQDPKKGFKTAHGSVSKVETEDTGLRAFVGRNTKGELYVAIPKNKTQAKKYERELKRTGTLSLPDVEQASSGLSDMTVENVALDEQGRIVMPESTPSKGHARGRTTRRQRTTRQR